VISGGPVFLNTGALVPDGTRVTLQVVRIDDPNLSLPELLEADLDATEEGIQVETAQGEFTARIADPLDGGQVVIGASTVSGSADGLLELRYAATLDADGDGHEDEADNCPFDINEDQADADADGAGDLCDPWPMDADNDGVPLEFDNCPGRSNVGQIDRDSDAVGDSCDSCPNVPNLDQADADMNGIGDVCQCGDVHGNGFTNVADALKIARGELSETDLYFGRCDVNGDGLCDLSDAFEITGGRVTSVPSGQLCPAYLEPPPEPGQ